MDYSKLVKYAYEIGKKSPNFSGNGLDKMPTKYSLISSSMDSPKTSSYSYKAAAFVNKDEKKVILSIAGTDFSDINDVVDDILISHQSVLDKIPGISAVNKFISETLPYLSTVKEFFSLNLPLKYNSVKEFNRTVIDKLSEMGEDIAEYSFETVGHSLGATLSDLAAADLIDKKVKVTQSITFDNPGSKGLFKAIYSDEQIKSYLENISFKAINVSPNIVNTVNEPLGKVYLSPKHTEKVQKLTKGESWWELFTGTKKAIDSVGGASSILKTVTDGIGIFNKEIAGKLMTYGTSALSWGNKIIGHPIVQGGLLAGYYAYNYGHLLNDVSEHSLTSFEDIDYSKAFEASSWGAYPELDMSRSFSDDLDFLSESEETDGISTIGEINTHIQDA